MERQRQGLPVWRYVTQEWLTYLLAQYHRSRVFCLQSVVFCVEVKMANVIILAQVPRSYHGTGKLLTGMVRDKNG